MTLEEILTGIRSGTWQSRVEAVRRYKADGNFGESADVKRRLPAAMPAVGATNGGTKALNVQQHSGVIVLDFDKLEEEQMENLKITCRNQPFILGAFTSPSGNGIKVFARVHPSIEGHKRTFDALASHFAQLGFQADPSGKDICRRCFLSYDPNLFVNFDAEPFSCYVDVDVAEGKDGGEGEGIAHRGTPPPSSPGTPEIGVSILTEHVEQTDETEMTREDWLYRKLVQRHFREVEQNTRNACLVEMMAFLHVAVIPPVAMRFSERFYRQHATKAKFKDSLERHLWESTAMLKGCETTFIASLSPRERELDTVLDEQMKATFRICKSLAERSEDGRSFTMSTWHLGDRLASVSMTGSRALKKLARLGVIRETKKGTRHQKGLPGDASEWKWLWDVTPLAPGFPAMDSDDPPAANHLAKTPRQAYGEL
jgi:hypothetical protein